MWPHCSSQSALACADRCRTPRQNGVKLNIGKDQGVNNSTGPAIPCPTVALQYLLVFFKSFAGVAGVVKGCDNLLTWLNPSLWCQSMHTQS